MNEERCLIFDGKEMLKASAERMNLERTVLVLAVHQVKELD